MNKDNIKSIARKRIDYLIELIKKSDLFDDYAVKMIEKIRTRTNTRLTNKDKEVFCKKCLKPYREAKIRFKKVKQNKIKYLQKIIVCRYCNAQRRLRVR